MVKEYLVSYQIEGIGGGSSYLSVADGKVLAENVVDDFISTLRKNEKTIIKDAADEEKSDIVDGLTHAQEEILKIAHGTDYHGTDDDMPDAYEAWIENLTLEELKSFLGL